jgi:hypothetical protein
MHDLTGRVWILLIGIKYAHTLPMQIWYPRVPISMGKITILSDN